MQYSRCSRVHTGSRCWEPYREREQFVEEVIELVDALRLAPHVIEPIDDDVEPLPINGEVGCGTPDDGPQLVGILLDTGHDFGMTHIELIHQRGRNVDKRDSVRTIVLGRQKVVVSSDGRAFLL